MKDVSQIMEKLSKANQLMEDLIDLAMADEEISDDEKEMLYSINKNLGGYARLIVDTVSDGKVTGEEREALNKLEEQIVSEASTIANKDENVTDEERKLLDELVQTVKSM